MLTRFAPAVVIMLFLGVVATTWRLVTWSGDGGISGFVLGDRIDVRLESLSRPPVVAQPFLTAEPTQIRANSGVVIDGQSGQVLLARNEQQSVPIASTTKVMSAVVLLQSGKDLDETATITTDAASQIGSGMGLKAGDRVKLRDLLAGALMVSGNDAVYAIADHFGGVQSFVAQMNTTAKEIGLENTRYFDPAGLDDRGRSTPFELAALFRYALTFEEFRGYASTDELVVITEQGNRYQLKNTNALVRDEHPMYFADAIAGKTGFTPDAGYCLIAAAKRDGHLLVGVVLRSNEQSHNAVANEAGRLLGWVFDHTEWRP